MEIIKENDIGFYDNQGVQTISAKQFDTARKFVFNIINDGELFDLTGCDAYLRILKADGTQFQGHECCTIDDNEGTITIDTSVGNGDQILVASGINKCELHLTDINNKSLTTWNFNINVEPRVHNGDAIISEDTCDALDQALENLTNFELIIDSLIPKTEKGVANGVATLDNNGKVPSTQLPDYTAADAFDDAKDYTDGAINNLIDSAPETMNTLKEISDALEENEDVVDALNLAIGTKASINELNAHTENTDIHITVEEKMKISEIEDVVDDLNTHTANTDVHMTVEEKTKLSGIADNANNYVHPITEGNKHIPSGGSSGKVLGWSADGTAQWVEQNGGQVMIDNIEDVMSDTTNNKVVSNGVIKEINTAMYNMCRIVVITNEPFIGHTITCTRDDKIFTKVVDNTRTVTFGVLEPGIWTLHNPITLETTDVEATSYGIYTVYMTCYKVYGVDIDFSATNPDSMCTYTDDAIGMTKGSPNWWTMPIFKKLKSCILVNGVVQGYLKEDDVSKHIDNSVADITTLGNDVMLEIGTRIGYSIEWDNTNTNILHVKVTDNPNDDNFNYDAFSLDTYNDCDKIYIGRYKGYSTDSKIYSSSDRNACFNVNIDQVRTMCRARGTGYQQRSYASVKLMQCLYIIFFGNLNSQSVVGWGRSSYDTGIYSLYTGGGNAYGRNSEVIKTSNPSYMTDGKHQVVCLMLEDFWGNVDEFVDGIYIDASRNILTCKCAANFNTQGTDYDNNGNGGVTSNISNFTSRPQGSSNSGFLPKTCAGSDSTYLCDVGNLKSTSVIVCGGWWNHYSEVGAFYLSCISLHEYFNSVASISCRLMYLHKEYS